MQSFRRGVLSGFAMLRTSPGAALAAIAALAVGMGASTTMFSIVRGGTRGLPFEDAGAIVAVERRAIGPGALRANTLRDYRLMAGASSFEGLQAFRTQSVNLGGEQGSPERISTAAITIGTLGVLRVQPAEGRGFMAADAATGADPVAILSHGLWTRRYAGDRSVLGRSIRLDGVSRTVVGVMPPGFGFPINAAAWVPLAVDDMSRDAESVQVFGRLAAGASRRGAEAELLAVLQAGASGAEARASMGVGVLNFVEIETPRETRWGLYLMLLAASGVLVIACVNVASLFIARAVARSREVAVRLALGARRGQILVEHIAESLVFSGLASMIGLAMAWAGTTAFRLASADILEAFWMDFRVDPVVVFYASLLAVAAAAAASIVPALRASRTDVIATLRDGGLGASSLRIGRLSRGLLAAQMAFACGLLALTLLLGRAAFELHARPWPFDADALLTAQISVPLSTMDDDASRALALRRLEEELRAMPGVRSASLVSVLPGRGAVNWPISFDGPAAATGPFTGVTTVSPNYFETLGARVIRGRGLSPQDAASGPTVAVVNERFVARFAQRGDLVGRQVFIGRLAVTIVGVVPDLLSGDIDEPERDGMYVSIHQMRPFAVRALVAGVTSDPLAMVMPMRAAVARVNGDWPLFEVVTARQAALRDKQVLDIISRLFGVFGAGALLLTAVGLYSVTAFSIALRRREFGIRVALGASRVELLGMLSRQCARQLAIGLGAGAALAFALTQAFTAAMSFAAGRQGGIVGSVMAGLLFTAAAAYAGPVIRAARTDAVAALRDNA